MSSTYEIPLSPEPQSFAITLGATEYRLGFLYCDAEDGGWIMNIADADGAPLANGLPLVTGHDLVEQYRHLGIAGSLYVVTDVVADAVPTFDSLGETSHLLFVVT